MPHRTPCTWRIASPSKNVSKACRVCYGHVHVNGHDICPFHSGFKLVPEVQHLLTAEERYYSISQLRKLEELREG